MQKEFNDTGLCIPNRYYMVENSEKLKQIMGARSTIASMSNGFTVIWLPNY